ncbi:MAG: hypothetical protein QME63_04395 [Actinomycetota bacterium]|nr:hypothetical protein [Actinomycetota bacterium]
MFIFSNKPQTDNGKQTARKTAEIESPLFPTKVRILLLATVIVSFMAAIFLTGWDVFTVTKSQISNYAVRLSGARGKITKGKKVKRPLPPVHPLRFFPREIEGYTLFGPQKVPGEGDYAAEAVLKPEEEEFAAVEPISVYIRITYYGSNDIAQKAIDRDLSVRGISDRVNIEIGDAPTNAGYTKDQGMLLVEWVKSGYVVEVSANYEQAVPMKKTGTLEKHVVKVGNMIRSAMVLE